MRSHLDVKSGDSAHPGAASPSAADENSTQREDGQSAVLEEEATPFQGRPAEHFRETLSEAAAAAPGRKLGAKLLVLTHRSPDPDGLGACEGIRRLCGPEGFGYEVDVATVGRIHRAENLAMVRALDLHLLDYNSLDLSSYFGCVLVDSQPQFGHTVVPEELPMLAVFDHHVPPSEDAPPVPHQDVRLGVGASSSIVYEYLREVGAELDQKTSSALFCGVRYDTADLSRNSAALDEEAYYETFRRSDRQSIAHIAHPVLPRAYYKDLHAALSIARQHGALVIALLNRVSHPEFVAEMADFLLRMKGCSWVLVGGAYAENGSGSYVLSLRTDSAFGHAYPLMKRVLDGQGSFGGHGHIAGGRIPLEDLGESTVAACERELRKNALAVIGGNSDDDEDALPLDGRPLF